MKLVSFGNQGEERPAVVCASNQFLIDLNQLDPTIPSSLLEFLRHPSWDKFEQKITKFSLNGTIKKIKISEVRLGPCIPNPGKIICLGLNYKDHANEGGRTIPETPKLFSKASSSVTGPNDSVHYPKKVKKLDYEVELAFVIGKISKKIKKKDAYDHIAGYCTFNDISARCAQFDDGQFFRGKSMDTFAPIGPYLVTKNEIKNPMNLDLWSKVNGELRQNSNTKHMIFDIPSIMEFITDSITLYPGDIISTGTPSGVGIFFNPPKLLKIGDVVEMEVCGLGKIKNKIV